MKLKALFLTVMVSGLAGCGGGSSTDASSNDFRSPGTSQSPSGDVALVITDNLAQDYAEVWVTIKEIDAISTQGDSITLFKSAQGEVVNLSELVNVGQLLSLSTAPAGTHNQFRVEMANQVRLVSAEGVNTDANFNNSAQDAEVVVSGVLTVAANAAVTLTLDFDLAKFTYNAVNGTVASAIAVIIGSNDLTRTYTEIEGRVLSVINDSQFEMQSEHKGIIKVSLGAYSLVLDKKTMRATANTAAMQVGEQIEIYGNYQSEQTTIEAITVRIDDAQQTSTQTTDKVKGNVVSFDGSVLVVNARQASFLPNKDRITIANANNAAFVRGNAALLNEGQYVEIEGHWDGATLTAGTIEIEGATSQFDERYGEQSDHYLELKGRVQALDGDSMTIVAQVVEHTDQFAASDIIVVDLSNAWRKNRDEFCLGIGTEVEVKGALTQDRFIASVVEIEDDCQGSRLSEQNHDDHNDDAEHNDHDPEDEEDREDRDERRT